MRKSTILIPLLLLLLSPALTRAQQVVPVNRGSIRITELQFPQASYEFSGPNTTIQAFIPGGDGVAQPNCVPCVGGSEVALSANFTSWKAGTWTINGENSNGVVKTIYIKSSLNLVGGQLTVPNRLGVIFSSVTVPAALTGSLVGYPRNPNFTGPGNDPIFITPVSFQGTATVYFRYFGEINDVPWFASRQIIYNFPELEQSASK